jgi:hypothetical protein
MEKKFRLLLMITFLLILLEKLHSPNVMATKFGLFYWKKLGQKLMEVLILYMEDGDKLLLEISQGHQLLIILWITKIFGK